MVKARWQSLSSDEKGRITFGLRVFTLATLGLIFMVEVAILLVLVLGD